MKSFFPMVRREGTTLVFLIAFAAFAFIPVWRELVVGGMAVFGWLIAALMLISPPSRSWPSSGAGVIRTDAPRARPRRHLPGRLHRDRDLGLEKRS